jgi:hypothetical protein
VKLFDQKVFEMLYRDTLERLERGRRREQRKMLLAIFVGAAVGFAGVSLIALLAGVLR